MNPTWAYVGALYALAAWRARVPWRVALLFYAVVTPLGLLMRLTAKDPLRLGLDERAESYWIARRPPGPPRP